MTFCSIPQIIKPSQSSTITTHLSSKTLVKTVQLNRKINETICTDLIFNKHTTTTTTTTTTLMTVKNSKILKNIPTRWDFLINSLARFLDFFWAISRTVFLKNLAFMNYHRLLRSEKTVYQLARRLKKLPSYKDILLKARQDLSTSILLLKKWLSKTTAQTALA